MLIVRFPLHRLLTACVLVLMSCVIIAQAQESLPPDEALEKLKGGNDRFIKGQTLEKHYTAERAELSKSQHPYAIILTCSDSRVAPEAVFDETLGKLFVVRVAGNVSDPVILGSIEYAVEHLHASLLMVMGHESCGAVKAAVSNSAVPPNIAKIIQRLRPAVDKVRVYSQDEDKIMDAAVRENVRYQVKMMTFDSDVLAEFVHDKKLKIVGSVYNLHTGKVEMLPEKQAEEQPEKIDQHAKPAVRAKNSEPAQASPLTTERESVQPLKKAAPVRAAPAGKTETKGEKEGHSGHHLSELGKELRPQPHFEAGRNDVAFIARPFDDKLRTAFHNNTAVILKKTLLMHDSRDDCVTPDCRSLSAGEIVRIDSPVVLEVMGRPNIRIRHGKQTFYAPADERNFEFTEAGSAQDEEARPGLVSRILTAPARLMNAVNPLSRR